MNMKTKLLCRILFFSLLFLLYNSQSEAREWVIVGPRALGMGGANVAVANDATASYWNPAAYGFFKSETGGDYGKRWWSESMDVGVGAQIHEDLGNILNNISDIDYDALDNGQISANKVSDYIRLINELKIFNDNKNRAITITANAGPRVQVGRWGLGVYAFGEMSARGQIDLINISPTSSGSTYTIDDFTNPSNYGCPSPCTGGSYLSNSQKAELQTYLSGLGWTSTQINNYINAMDYGLTQSASVGAPISSDAVSQIENAAYIATMAAGAGGSFSNNQSMLLFKGIALIEVPLTYGHPITDDLAVGMNIKYMKARVYNTYVEIFNTDFGDALNEAKDDYVESQNFGVDLGLLYRFGDSLRFGMIGRNLNSPRFDMKPLSQGDDNYMKEKAQIRGGVAYKPFDFMTLAADIDFTRNDTTISDDYKSQNIGGGLELNLFKIMQLRVGAYKNIAESDIGLVYTAGIGLNFWLINFDIGAAYASKSNKVDDYDIPNESKVEIALSMLF